MQGSTLHLKSSQKNHIMVMITIVARKVSLFLLSMHCLSNEQCHCGGIPFRIGHQEDAFVWSETMRLLQLPDNGRCHAGDGSLSMRHHFVGPECISVTSIRSTVSLEFAKRSRKESKRCCVRWEQATPRLAACESMRIRGCLAALRLSIMILPCSPWYQCRMVGVR